MVQKSIVAIVRKLAKKHVAAVHSFCEVTRKKDRCKMLDLRGASNLQISCCDRTVDFKVVTTGQTPVDVT